MSSGDARPPVLGPYRPLRKIADGGFGSVYEAAGPDGRRVAVKLLRALDPEAVTRFDRERRLLGTLGEAEGFVPLVDAGFSADGPWIAMPLLEGGTLRDKLRAKGKLEPGAALALGRALARALGAAHALGIIHRDLKPENVLFTRRGRALIADLGLAKHFGAVGTAVTPTITRPDVLAGTIGYMAPEQVEDARTVYPAADVFSLGVILYECFAGQTPFEAQGVLSFVQSVSGERPKPLRARGVAIPASIDAAIMRAIEPDPKVRFADGAAFARALVAPGRRVRPIALVVAALVLGAVVIAGLAGLRVWRAASLALRPPAPPEPPRPDPPRPAAPPEAPAAATPAPSSIEAAEAALEARRYGEALEIAQRLLDASPRDARALWTKGEARVRLGDDYGHEELLKAVTIEPTARRYLRIGEVVRDIGKRTRNRDLLARSTAAFQRALELDPGLDEAWFHRGLNRLSFQADAARALSDFDEACRLHPGEVDYIVHRGWALANLGRREEAIADFGKTLELDPRNLLALRWRSEQLEAVGDLDGAVRDLEAIVRLEEPRGEQRKVVEPRLAALRKKLGR